MRRGRDWLMPFGALFHRLIDRIDAAIEVGTIEAALPDGRLRRLGGRGDGPVAIIEVRRWRALVRLMLGGSGGWYEAWAAGDWASPDPVALIALFGRNRRTLGETGRARGIVRWVKRLAHAMRRNTRGRARRNIAAHYDLGNDFYREWLDPTLSYSSALFAPGDDLEAAQRRKLAAILERTATRAGDTILEIGCGWGGFAAYAAHEGRRVHAITLSAEQAAAVRARGAAGVDVAITDYRDVRGQFDAVVSIEMVEAVGQRYWDAYLAAIARALRPGGHAAIQYIAIDEAIFERYAANVDFIQAYVFPGGMLLSETRFRALAGAHGLEWRDRRGFGGDYAQTLRLWRERFEAAVREGRLPARFDARFVALWRYYLMYCEGGFRGGGIDVAQVTLVRR